jgi:phosphoglycolate phosphatase
MVRPTVGLPPLSPGLTLFCDFDGPLVDVSDRYYLTYKLALAKTRSHYRAEGRFLQVRPLSKSQFWRLKQNRTPDVEIVLRSGLPEWAMDYFLGQVRQLVNAPALLRRDRLQPGAAWALQQLQAQGVFLVLVTLRCQEQAQAFLAEQGLLAQFSRIYGTQCADAAYQNYTDLKGQLLAQAMADFGVDAKGGGWMVGDTEADILAAQRMGIPSIGLTCGIRSQAYLDRLKPTVIHNSLLELVRAVGHKDSTSCYGQPQR